jgi:hypothetical protein
VATQWFLSDAWVFSSIEGAGPGDGYTLTQVIAKADGINHAILTEAEFTQAVPRLVAADLIGAQPETDRYWHTDVGLAMYRQRMKRHGLFGWIDAIPPALHQLGEPQDTAWSLPAGVFDRAARDYLQRADTILRRLGVQPQDPGDTP